MFDEKEPIYSLEKVCNPQGGDQSNKQCFSCLKPNGADVLCQFCGNKSCKECSMKKRPFPGQKPPDNGDSNQDEQQVAILGDALVKGQICKVCERKFQMHIFWFNRVPLILGQEDQIKMAYLEHKRKVKELDTVKKECQDQRQELVSIGTQRLNYEEEKRVEIE